MQDRGRIGLVALVSALVFSALAAAGSAPASIPGFGPLHDVQFRVTFQGSISTHWKIPEYVSATEYCFVERTSGSGIAEVTFPPRTNPYHALDTGSGPIYLQPNEVNAGGTRDAAISEHGDIFEDYTSSGNMCNPDEVPASAHEDNSGCGSASEAWTMSDVIIADSKVRPEPAADNAHPLEPCPFYGPLSRGFSTSAPFVQEDVPHIRSLLARKRGVILIHGKQTLHQDTPSAHAHATATVTWTMKIKRLKGMFTG